jgi:plastocyanin
VLPLLLLIGVGIGAFSHAPVLIVPNVHAANVAIVLTGCVFTCPNVGWNGTTSNPNPTITVTRGDIISLSLSSGDAISHRFLIERDGEAALDTADCPEIDPCSALFPPSTTYTFTVTTDPAGVPTVTTAPGSYTYYCTLHPMQMHGSLVVNPDTSVGGVAGTVDKLGILAPYVSSAIAILGAMAASVFYLHRRNSSSKAERKTT